MVGKDSSSGSRQRRPYCVGNASKGGGNPLVRHSSSPAGFVSHLMLDSSFPVPADTGSCSQPGIGVSEVASRRSASQLSFSRNDTPSQISQFSIPVMGDRVGCSNNSNATSRSIGQSLISSNFSAGTWDQTNSINFSAPPSKRASDFESQISLPHMNLEIASVEYLQLQHDLVACKVRAKRGCATHPRSIVERERGTRVSEKLKKLQELVPDVDKETNTAEMLDLAIKHIMQRQAWILKKEHENCTCKRAGDESR